MAAAPQRRRRLSLLVDARTERPALGTGPTIDDGPSLASGLQNALGCRRLGAVGHDGARSARLGGSGWGPSMRRSLRVGTEGSTLAGHGGAHAVERAGTTNVVGGAPLPRRDGPC